MSGAEANVTSEPGADANVPREPGAEDNVSRELGAEANVLTWICGKYVNNYQQKLSHYIYYIKQYMIYFG